MERTPNTAIPAEAIHDPAAYADWKAEQAADHETELEHARAAVAAHAAARKAEEQAAEDAIAAKRQNVLDAEWQRIEAERRALYRHVGGTDAEFEAAWPNIKASIIADRMAERDRNAARARL